MSNLTLPDFHLYVLDAIQSATNRTTLEHATLADIKQELDFQQERFTNDSLDRALFDLQVSGHLWFCPQEQEGRKTRQLDCYKLTEAGARLTEC